MASSLPSRPLVLSLYLLLLFPMCFGTDNASITYHGGPLLTGNLNLTLIWYGQFGHVHKNAIRAFIESLHYNAGANLQPQVSSWWKIIESYQEVAGKGSCPVNVKVVKQVTDPKYSAGKVISSDFIQQLLQKVTGGDSNAIPVLFVARDVQMQELCFTKCSQHGIFGEQPYIVVGNPESECPGACAWPFQKPDKGPLSITLNPPNGNLGADAMVIAFARAFVEAVTNPFKTGFFQDNSNNANITTIEAASACWGIFGSGAFDGFTGKVRVDPNTGGGFNGHGSRGTKFLIPSVWNPKTKSCWTLL